MPMPHISTRLKEIQFRQKPKGKLWHNLWPYYGKTFHYQSSFPMSLWSNCCGLHATDDRLLRTASSKRGLSRKEHHEKRRPLPWDGWSDGWMYERALCSASPAIKMLKRVGLGRLWLMRIKNQLFLALFLTSNRESDLVGTYLTIKQKSITNSFPDSHFIWSCPSAEKEERGKWGLPSSM